MDLASLIGIISGIGLIVAAIILGGDIHNFFNVPGVMIVMGGTMAATLLTFQFRDVLTAFRSAYFVFSSPKQDSQELINTMIKLGTISRRKGLLSLMDVKTKTPFLKRVCTLIADAADEETLRSAMRTEIESMQMRHYYCAGCVSQNGNVCPFFWHAGNPDWSSPDAFVTGKPGQPGPRDGHCPVDDLLRHAVIDHHIPAYRRKITFQDAS